MREIAQTLRLDALSVQLGGRVGDIWLIGDVENQSWRGLTEASITPDQAEDIAHKLIIAAGKARTEVPNDQLQ